MKHSRNFAENYFQMHYKTTKPKGFFDEAFRLENLSGQKDPLVKLKERIDFELFRPLLEETQYAKKKKE